jgi:two-component system response regulator (stage 0 sporulation protein A)
MRAVELGAKFYLVKPFQPDILLGHIRRLASGQEVLPVAAADAAPRERSLDERLGSLFLTLGIPAHIKGYQYLRTGVKMAVENPAVVNRITKELYPGIAARFDTTASKVERAIRHAIEVAWNRGRVDTLNRVLGCRACTPEDKPTNGEFIAMLADKLRLDLTA